MGIHIIFIVLAVAAAMLAYFSISVSSVMITVNLIAIGFVVAIETAKVITPDSDYSWAENRKFAFIDLCAVLVAANLSVLLLLKML
jgi:hypothetical protein